MSVRAAGSAPSPVARLLLHAPVSGAAIPGCARRAPNPYAVPHTGSRLVARELDRLVAEASRRESRNVRFIAMNANLPTICGMRLRMSIAVLVLVLVPVGQAQARTVYRCVRGDTVSLSTAPEPGSKCEARTLADDAAMVPNLWGNLGVFSGNLYEWRAPDGRLVYTTRRLPGATPYLRFTVETPKASPAHVGLGKLGTPRLDAHAKEFRAAAKAQKVDDAFLRAIAHAESGFDAKAVSPKGAQGVMQLMPEVQREYGVIDPFASKQSIDAGARLLRALLRRYKGDFTLAAAAYNAGIGSVAKFGGVPPYAETLAYVEKVRTLHDRYRRAMGVGPLHPPLRAAQ